MDSPSAPGRVFRFGQFEARADTGRLFKQGREVKLQEQPFRLLVALLERQGRVVSRQELKEALWPNGLVEFDKSLDVAMAKLRQALGDDFSNPRFIATIPRRGYQFVGPLTLPGDATFIAKTAATPVELSPVAPAVPRKSTLRPPLTLIAVGLFSLAAIAIGAIGLWQWQSHHAAPPLASRASILIGDFTNSTGDASFDHSLRTAAVIEFQQSPYLDVLSDDQIGAALQAMGRPPDDPLEAAISRQVCQQQHAAVTINGSIQRQDKGYLLSLFASRCSDGDMLAKVGYPSPSKDQVLATLGRAIAELRKEFGESKESLSQYDVVAVSGTTNSLEALKAFQLGMDLRSHTRNIDAIPAFKTAIALDPSFAIAYAQLGSCYSNMQNSELAIEFFSKAFELREHATEPERLYITGRYFDIVTAETEKGAGIYKLWTEIYPSDWVGHNALANDANLLGRYVLAAEEAEHVITLKPEHSYGYTNRAIALLSLNRLDEAVQVAREAIRRGRDGGLLHSVLFAAALIESNEPDLMRERAWAAVHPNDLDIPLAEAAIAEGEGRIKDSNRLFDSLVNRAMSQGSSGGAGVLLAQKALFDAEMGVAKSAMNNIQASAELGTEEFALELSGLAYARLGNSVKAKQLQSEIDRRHPLSTFNISVFAPTIRTALSISTVPTEDEIIAAMKPAASYEIGQQAVLIPTYIRATALLSVQSAVTAEVEFKKIIDHRGVDASSPLFSLAHLGLARSLAMQHRLAEARKAYEDVLKLWKTADADLPVLLQAKRELDLLSTH